MFSENTYKRIAGLEFFRRIINISKYNLKKK